MKKQLKLVIKKLNVKPLLTGFKQLRHNQVMHTSLQRTLQILFGNRFFAILVVIPTLIYFSYSLILYTPRYESVASIAIKDNSNAANFGGLSSLLGSTSSGTTNVYMLQKYILSINMLQELNRTIDIIKLYSSHKIDFISRLSATSDQKSQLAYFNSKIDVTYNQDSQSLDISAQGITPEEARKILTATIAAAQNYVNSIDAQLSSQRLDFAQKQVELARQKLTDSNDKIINFQNSNDILDPKSDMANLAGIMAGLQSQLVGAQTELINLQQVMQDNSSQVVTLKDKISSIQHQIDIQKQQILGLDGGENTKLNQVVNRFEFLRMQSQVAISEYTAAIASLESAKADAIKQKQQVVIIQNPTLPDYYEYPRLWYNTLTLFIILLMVYGIIRMAKTIIDEHRY